MTVKIKNLRPKTRITPFTENPVKPRRVSFIITEDNNENIKKVQQWYRKKYNRELTRTSVINLALRKLFTEEETITNIITGGVPEHD